MVTAATKWKDVCSWKKSYNKSRQGIKKKRHHFSNKGPYSQNYGFCSSHVWMWQLDHKEGWEPKNWCFWTIAVENTLQSPLDYKEIKPVSPNGNQPWIFIERTDAEAEAPVLWSPDAKSWLIRKDSDAGKEWRPEEKWVTEDEEVGWHHWLNKFDFEQSLEDSEGQGSLVCFSLWGGKKLNMTELLNNNK